MTTQDDIKAVLHILNVWKTSKTKLNDNERAFNYDHGEAEKFHLVCNGPPVSNYMALSLAQQNDEVKMEKGYPYSKKVKCI